MRIIQKYLNPNGPLNLLKYLEGKKTTKEQKNLYRNNKELSDNTYVKRPKVYYSYSYKFLPSYIDLGGKPGKNITQKDRDRRLRRESNEKAVRDVVKGLLKTFGNAISMSSLLYGGGWALNRLLNFNKPSTLGLFFGKYVLPSNAADNVSDGIEMIVNPSIEGAVDLGTGIVLGKFKDFGNPVRLVGELVGQGANINNMKQGGKMNIIKLFKEGGQIRKMLTVAGGPIKESHLSYGYPVYWSDEVPSRYKWAKEYLKNHPDVTGFAVGGGAQGPGDTGPREIIRNSHSSILPNHNDGRWYGLDKIEAIRHYMNETGYTPNFEESPEQKKFRRDNFSNEDQYGRNDTAWKQSIISRITADEEIDKEFGVTPEQFKDYTNIMRGLNSKMDNHYNIPNEHRGGYYLPEITVTRKKKQGGKIIQQFKNRRK